MKVTDATVHHVALAASSASELQGRLAEILDEYLTCVEQGLTVDVEQLTDGHPELAEPLREYLDGLALLQGGVSDFRIASPISEGGSHSSESTARRLGDYEIIEEIGRGGMGVVYEARQISLDRKVALKVLPFASVLDQKQLMRFQNEARAAAQLHHPNIVPIHGVGSDRGVNYYAMQFIEGRSLAQAVDELRLLYGIDSVHQADSRLDAGRAERRDVSRGSEPRHASVSESTGRAFTARRSLAHMDHMRSVSRLGLQTAEALHAAHQCGVIHRDVKPSNLMIDAQGKLWVTDFGLARCQTNGSFTKSGDIVGTLHYMSPEQSQGKSALADQRTDVYSLGVTLYELLTLRRAFEDDSYSEVKRQIENGVWKRPRAWNPAIPKDLENVIGKAMATSRDDRYASAQDLADDLRRFLEGKPTRAKPPSVAQRLAKWSRRHRTAVAAAAVVLLVAFAGLIASTVLIAKEQSRTAVALAESRTFLAEAESAVDLFGSRAVELLANIPASESARRALLVDVRSYHERFLQRAGDSPELRAKAVLTYGQLAKLSEQLGDREAALDQLREAERLLRELAHEQPDVAKHEIQRARCLNNIGLLLRDLRRTEQATNCFDAAIAVQQDISDHDPAAGQPLVDLALSWNNKGLLMADVGRHDQAAACYRTAVDLLKDACAASPQDKQPRQTLAKVYQHAAMLGRDSGAMQPEKWIRLAFEIQENLVASAPHDASCKSDLAQSYNTLATLQARSHNHVEAIAAYDKAIALQRALAEQSPLVTAHRRDLAVTLNNQGLAHSRVGQLDAARDAFRAALDLQHALWRDFPSDVAGASRLGGIYNNLARVHQSQNDLELAATTYKKGITFQLFAHQKAPQAEQFREYLSRSYFNYGSVLRKLNRPCAAAELALRRRELWPHNGKQLFSVAQELALTCRVLPNDDAERVLYANEAIKTLKQAANAGWKPAGHFRNDPAFQALRTHATTIAVRTN